MTPSSIAHAYIRLSREDERQGGTMEEKVALRSAICQRIALEHGLILPAENIHFEQKSGAKSFHTHVAGTDPIPQDTSTKEARATRKKALDEAGKVRTRLIGTLRNVVKSTAGVLAASTTTP